MLLQIISPLIGLWRQEIINIIQFSQYLLKKILTCISKLTDVGTRVMRALRGLSVVMFIEVR